MNPVHDTGEWMVRGAANGRNRGRSPSEILSQAMRRTRLGEELRPIFMTHPVIRDVLERLCYYQSDKVIHPSGVALNHLNLHHGLRGYRAWREEAGEGGRPEDDVAAFLASAFRAVPYLIEIEAVADSGSAWDPLEGEPLTRWLTYNAPAVIRRVEPEGDAGLMTPRAFRAAIAYHVMSPEHQLAAGGDMNVLINGVYG